jgi:hypothetical protein
MQNGASCAASPSSELLKAVNAYLTDPSIEGPSRALAATLDGLANTAVNDAVTNAQSAIGSMPSGSGRQRQTKTNVQQAVAAGQVRHY